MSPAIGSFFRQLGRLFRWWVVVAPWEQAVRVRMGKKVRVLNAGVHVRIPGIDRIFRQSTRRRYTVVPTQTVTTADSRTLTLTGGLGYSIHDIGTLYDTLHDAEDVLEMEAMSAISRFVAARDLAECPPQAIEEAVANTMDLARYGLGDFDFCVTNFAVVRTYRLINGEPKSWKHGPGMDTQYAEGQNTP